MLINKKRKKRRGFSLSASLLNPNPHEIARCYLHSVVFLEVGMGLSVQGFFSSVPSFVYMRWLKCSFLLWFYHFHDCGSLYLLAMTSSKEEVATSPCHTSKSTGGNTFLFFIFFACLKDWIFIICLWGFCESRKEDVGAINGFTLCTWYTML